MKPESKVIAARWARKTCVKRLIRKVQKFGKVMVSLTVTDDPEWYKLDTVEATMREDAELAAVLEALREEQFKRGLR